MDMPMEYETMVSEGGNALSGGQRQRLALARAVSHAPAILLLDEATSSLDVVTERAVEQNMRQLPCTQIIIAHRLSTIRSADLILVIDQGKIVERGTHHQLLGRSGYYSQLIYSQLANGEIKENRLFSGRLTVPAKKVVPLPEGGPRDARPLGGKVRGAPAQSSLLSRTPPDG